MAPTQVSRERTQPTTLARQSAKPVAQPVARQVAPPVVVPVVVQAVMDAEVGETRGAGGLLYACRLVATGLAGLVLLVGAGCLVSLGWNSNHALAVGIVVALLAAAGTALAWMMAARPEPRSHRRS